MRSLPHPRRKTRLFLLRDGRGFSLMEILITSGLLGLLALGGAAVQRVGLNSQRGLTMVDDARTLTTSMATGLSSQDACLATFGGQNPIIGFPATAIRDGSGAPAFETGKVYGNKSLRLAAVTVGGAGVDERTGLARYNALSPTNGTALVQVGWGKNGEAFSAQNLNRFFTMNVTLDANNLITACSANGANPSQIWTRSTLDPAKIFYNDGNVGIGTAEGTTLLDVRGEVRIGATNPTSNTCTADQEGAFRYHKDSKTPEFCDGTNWLPIGDNGIDWF